MLRRPALRRHVLVEPFARGVILGLVDGAALQSLTRVRTALGGIARFLTLAWVAAATAMLAVVATMASRVSADNGNRAVSTREGGSNDRGGKRGNGQ